MAIPIKLTERQWDLVLQSLYHRHLQTGNEKIKADLKDIETRIDAQIRENIK